MGDIRGKSDQGFQREVGNRKRVKEKAVGGGKAASEGKFAFLNYRSIITKDQGKK